jgi:hypothetical protein
LEEDRDELLELLASLELRLERRIVRAPFRSPETLFEELDVLCLVIDLQRNLQSQR